MRQAMLIPMLGNSQADELVLYPQTTIEDVLPQSTASGALQPLSKARIERTLDGVDLNRNRDREDDVYSIFSDDERLPSDLIAWYLIEGNDKDMLRLLCTVDLTIPQEQLGHALLLCNEFHRASRLGRGYVAIKEGQPEARVFFESTADLSEGVTDAYLERFIMLSLYAAHVFFEKTRQQKLLVPARPRKRSKTNHKQEVLHQ